MNNKLDLKEGIYLKYSVLVDSFLDFEYDNRLFDIYIENIQVWPNLRERVLYMLRDYLVENMVLNSMSPKPASYKFNPILKSIDVNICRNTLIKHKQKDLLILSSMRKIDAGNGYYRDDYTYWLDKYLVRSHYILDRWDYSKQESSNVLRCNPDYFFKKRYGFNREKLDKRNRVISVSEFDEKIIHPIENAFSISFNIIEKKTLLQIANYRTIMEPVFNDYYDYLFSKIKPKIVMFSMRGATNSQVLVKAARRWGIPSVELGHAITDRTYIQSNFHSGEVVSTFPDYYFSYGEYEIDKSRWPISKTRVVPVGSPMLDCISGEYRDKKRGEKKKILFISNMRESVFVYANYVATHVDRDKYDVIIKLHPGECSSWQESYGTLLSTDAIDIIDTYDKPIYYYLNMADWVVGLSSNALYEASTYDLNIAIINAEDTIEHPLLAAKKAVLINNPGELMTYINGTIDIEKGKLDLYSSDSIKKINDKIEEIIKGNER